MSAHRFRFLGRREDDGRWRVDDEDEVTHFGRVLRLEVGCEVEVCDGAGRAAVGTVVEAGKKAFLVLPQVETVAERKTPRLVLALGALKHGALDEILASLVELGIDEVHAFLSEGVDKTRIAPKAVERWQRIATQALKQCKRPFAATVAAHPSLEALLAHLERTGSMGPGAGRFVLAPGASSSLLAASGGAKAAIVCVVGSEAGLGEGDRKRLAGAAFVPVHCGESILRAVTAALAAAAFMASHR